LDLEVYPGKGWTASAQLSRGLNSNNIKLQLTEDEDGELLFLINAAITKPATYYNRSTTSLTPLARCRIPRDGDTDNTSAFVKNGILTLMIPKKKIVVSRESPQPVPINRQPQRKVTSPPQQSQFQQPRQQQQQKTRIPVKPGSSSLDSSPKPIHATSNVPVSPMTARRLQIQSEEEDVFERSLKYAVPE